MKKIIEQVEALKISEYVTPNNPTYYAAKIVNDTIDKVLDILKAEFEERDQPDCEGWWYNQEYQQFAKVFDNNKNGNYWFEHFTAVLPVNMSKGKWVKARVPIKEGD